MIHILMRVLRRQRKICHKYYKDSCATIGGILAPQAWEMIPTEKHNSLCNASYGETINNNLRLFVLLLLLVEGPAGHHHRDKQDDPRPLGRPAQDGKRW
jgi:hypothetical protein